MNTLAIKQYLVCLCLACAVTLGFAQTNPASPKSGHLLTEEFIQQNLIYPQSDLDAGNKGKVVVAFHLDEKGIGSDYHVKETFSEAANDNALDMVKKILWDPATKNMLPTESDMEYTIEYSAKAYKRYWKKRERVALPLTMEKSPKP